MKVKFVFQDKTYFAESKKSAASFLLYWNSIFSKIRPLDTTWKIKGVEIAPGYGFNKIDLDDKIEYA